MKISNLSLITPDAINASGVYAIFNTVNEKVYIGSSGRLRDRLTSHIWHLRNNRHANAHLQSSWNKHGENCFLFTPIEYADTSEIEQIETDYIAKYKSIAYNIREFPLTNRGLKHSELTKIKISVKSKLNWQNADYRAQIIVVHKGKVLSEKTRLKISTAKLGKSLSESTKQAMRDADRKNLPKRTKEHQSKLTNTKTKCYVATSPEGKTFEFKNLREFCRINNLDQSHMGRVASKKQNNHKGWLCRYETPLITEFNRD